MENYALVLGGGGAKGAYEIGVWQALRELNIPINIVCGTSVGALNGAMIAQGDFELAKDLWTSISFESVVKVERELASVEEDRISLLDRMALVREAVSSGGLDTSPLKQLLNDIIDEKKIRESSIDFGLVTFSLTDFKPVKIFKKDIPEGKMVDYLLASACFPAFKPLEIDSKKYIDGGVYDNIPISLAIDRGAKKIIAVDVSGPGITRSSGKKSSDILYIKNKDILGGVLEFDSEKSKANMNSGYLDTLKTFGMLKGCKYYIKDENKEKIKYEFINKLKLEDLKKIYSFLGIDFNSKTLTSNRLILDVIIRTIQQYTDGKIEVGSIYAAMAEITAEQLDIDKKMVYSMDDLIDEILKKYDDIKNSDDFKQYVGNIKKLIMSKNQLEFDREIKKSLIEGKFLISYNTDFKDMDEKIRRFRRFVAIAFPKISIANMFITLLIDNINKCGN
ncbi:NTE family protein [Caloramator quimbayensis]|uniref:NTE family protein n=1 Tax=Caloramator quimbayensis TaxID=1147123 RepID=A0A1T4XQB5_9CLOT|nr:patatin-like phospholipase family protein [Caloramator quimbayensis]SKA91736.1 NTE family protein [Caloramator quimbayensis]